MALTSKTETATGHGAVDVPAGLVDARLARLFDEEQERWASVDLQLAGLLAPLRDFVLGPGKRLRPAFCYWGHLGGGGSPDDAAMIEAAGALELLHSFALLHDDVMDGSEQRRGAPAMHVAWAAMHDRDRLRGEGRRFGEGLSILAGDLAFMYANRLAASLSAEARQVWDDLCVELTMGQYLDVLGTARGDRRTSLAELIASYKSGRYTVVRPLHLGAAIAGAPAALAVAYTAFGGPLGEAFQLRDDLLGVFGDQAETGKPVGEDLREGKPTLLLAYGVTAAPASARALLDRVGAPDLRAGEVEALREVLVDTGAAARIERDIDERLTRSLDALEAAPIDDAVRSALRQLADLCAWRTR